ncbi:MAG TPA: hypothetical protein VIC04_05950 [Terriglobia bacterium]|jgi:hypothetical protein
MLRRLGAAIYRGLFWTYERGTWQYDIMVALILAFIFLTPREWFHDQPVSPIIPDVVLLSSSSQERVYQLRATLIDASAAKTVTKQAERVLQTYTGKPVQITRIEPDVDSRGQVVSYAVWVQE